MKGLILKDILMMRQYFLKQLALMSIIFVFLSVLVLKSFAMMATMLTMSVMMIFVSSFSFDEACKWDAYALTLPVAPKDLVGAKYILFYGALLTLSAASILVTGLLDAVTFQEGLPQIAASAGVVTGFYILVTSLVLPVIYKIGAEKARVAMSLCFMVPFLAVVWGASYLESAPEAAARIEDFFTALPVSALIAAAVLFLLVLAVGSYFLSVRFYKEKEF